MSIFLVRHGETALNAARVLQPADTPLSPLGEEQARRLAPRLQRLGYARILASDLPRARATAGALSALTGVAIETTALLQERNFGELRGLPYAELVHDVFAPGYAPPAGESWDAFHERVALAFALVVRTRQALRGNLVVVTHGLVCRAMLQRHVRLQEGAAVPERFGNTSLTIIDATAPHQVRLLACTAHLQTASGAGAPA